MTTTQAALSVAVAALVTIGLRFLPFWVFGGRRKTPPVVIYLGRVLPCAIMGMLVVYCLKGVSLAAAPYGLPELLAVGAVVLLHVWRRSTLLSIGGGTAIYMILIRLIG